MNSYVNSKKRKIGANSLKKNDATVFIQISGDGGIRKWHYGKQYREDGIKIGKGRDSLLTSAQCRLGCRGA